MSFMKRGTPSPAHYSSTGLSNVSTIWAGLGCIGLSFQEKPWGNSPVLFSLFPPGPGLGMGFSARERAAAKESFELR
jgi:hypothetical protein